ncbi:ACT domain-containing protein [Halomarina rubra]|uniref:ACT domain-containing protein n=1 Tax=Halomarina rubra TaxID=2071873 RepID=A0ABD6AX35_9EURY|nr:ACT domain-containing protein [Halomarina rubra]
MDPASVLEESTVEVDAEPYAVATTDGDLPDTFATIRDRQETTHVITENRLKEIEAQKVEPGWALLTFDVVLPFKLVGFLAIVASELAENDVSIFALSAYSTDHILVQQADLEQALDTLSDLGCEIRRV